jgi:polar amino acid transport system substrate-binding protein
VVPLTDVPGIEKIIDIPELRKMMNDLFDVTKIGFALIDLEGNVMVATGWQDICTKFHRVNAETLKNCLESDLELTMGVKEGEYRIYQCKNGLVDIVTPLFIDGKHVANIFTGQFFFAGEGDNDWERFAAQAEKYGFDKGAYLDAFRKAPRWNREKIELLMSFYTKLTSMLSKKGYLNLRLFELLEKEAKIKAELEEYATRMELLAKQRAEQIKDIERLAAIGQTAGMVGHDIRNPLQSMVCDVYYLRKHYSDSEKKDEVIRSLESLQKSIFYINKIVADLQDYARPLKPEVILVDVEELVASILKMIDIPNSVTVEVDVSELPKLKGDPYYLQRALTNLIINSIQAMPDGGVLGICSRMTDGKALLIVSDTGEGIPEEVRNRLFTPMFTTKSKGQGFGLQVTKRLVEALGGAVRFESAKDMGTKFTVELPLTV